MGLFHSKLKLRFCGSDATYEINLITSIINSHDRNEFLGYMDTLLHYRNFELPKHYLKLVRPKVKIPFMKLAEKIRWIEELKSCVIEFYQITTYPVQNNSTLPNEIRTFEALHNFFKELFWEMTVEKDQISDTSVSSTGSLLNYAPLCFNIIPRTDDIANDLALLHSDVDESLPLLNPIISVSLDEEKPADLNQPTQPEVSELSHLKNNVEKSTGFSSDIPMCFNNEQKSKQNSHDQIDSLTLNHISDIVIIEDDSISMLPEHSESNDNIFSADNFSLNESEDLECPFNIIENDYETLSLGSPIEIETVTPNVIRTSLPDDFQSIIDLKYSKYDFKSLLSDPNISSHDSSLSDDTDFDVFDETTEAIRLYKERFKHSESTTTLKRDFIIDRPQSFRFGESPAVKNYIKSVVRIEVFKYFNLISLTDYEQRTLKCEMDLIDNNRIDPSSCLIKNNPNLIEIAAKSWLHDLDQLFIFYRMLYSCGYQENEWLQFEKSFIPSTISKVIGYVTFMQLVDSKHVNLEFLEKKIIEPIITAILKQLQHPFYHKTYESYRIPTNFKKFLPKINTKKPPEGLLIDMGVIKTNDERLDIEKFTQKFSNAVVFENLLYEENTYWNIKYSDKVLTLFKICDQIFEGLLDDCIQEISEYLVTEY